MEYRYNFSFLPKWMHENSITATELLDVMGTRDYATLRRWVKGDKIMKLDAILSLCNAYNISMSCFFINKDACADFAIPSEEYDDKIELPEEEVNKKYGINPYISKKRDTILPARWAKLFLSNTKDTEFGKSHDISEIKNDIEESKVLSVDEIRANFKQKEFALKKQLIDKDNIINNLSKALSNVTGLAKEPYKHIDDIGRDLVCEDLNK